MIARVLLCSAVLAMAGAPGFAAPRELVANPGFEQTQGGQAPGWAPYGQGYTLDSAVRHAGSHSLRCVGATAAEQHGASYVLALNQTTATPILVSGWSRAEGVEGGANADYSLYVDLEYTDGTPLWGQTAMFSAGTHDWQRRSVLIVPAKPVRTAHLYALFRSHAGTAWFDDISAVPLTGTGLFDSQPLSAGALAKGPDGGWFVRDAAADSPVTPIARASALGLRATQTRKGDALSLTVADTSGRNRALTLYYGAPFPAAGAVWGSDIRHSTPARGPAECANVTRIGAGANGLISLYPFACVTNGRKGLALGISPANGAIVHRLGYSPTAGLLYAAFDLALTVTGHRTATVAVSRYAVDPAWGFRSAAEGYYRRFPAAFDRRATAEGIWMPFTAPAKVPHAEEFGFAYHEGDNDIAGDDRLKILSFRYTEPMTWWMAMPTETPRTYDAAMAMVRDYAAGKPGGNRDWAQAVLNSATQDPEGRANVEFQNAPWTNGAVWKLNPNPAMPCPPGQMTKGRLSYTREMADRTYTGTGGKGQDGEYLDSLEGWADTLDYRPESLRAAAGPATFTPDNPAPVLQTWMEVYDLTRFMSEDLHRRGRLLMANATPIRLCAFAPLLDVMGIETNWNPGGRWRPDSDETMNLRRTICYHKPYLLLQNTDFSKFGYAETRKYLRRSMFYGIYPSMFSADASTSPYWEQPAWFDRDRDLFKHYIPWIQRLSAAGWEPVTHARSSNPDVWVERFGTRYFTLFNPGAVPATTTLRLDKPATLCDALTGAPLNGAISVGPEECVVVESRVESQESRGGGR